MEVARCDLSPRVLLPHFSSLLIQEHEGSRRMKTELLIQMDGLTASNDQVMMMKCLCRLQMRAMGLLFYSLFFFS